MADSQLSASADRQRDDADRSAHLTVVGIGASAGGLSALKEFLARVAPDSGLAYVVVVHLSPDHESHLSELLQPHVGVEVQQVTETVALEPDRIYVIPPNANLNAVDTHLRLSELESPAGERAPVDHFFRTLARTYDGHSVGVILTGTGSDGAQGIREIKAKGGLTIVQDPAEAEYSGMPRSAIATGEVDAVLPVAEIPAAVLRFTRTDPRVPFAEDEPSADGRHRRLMQEVFSRIRTSTGRDFSRYKRPTVLRRIARRMQLAQIEELDAYVELLRSDSEEVTALADDVLITVTSFFRDPEVFEAMRSRIVPRLFDGKGPDDTIRVWSVGCATGEEAYSVAMLLLEEAASRDGAPRIQVFASDLHEPSLAAAREGLYLGEIETDVSGERLERFFQPENGGYRVRKHVRELVLFSAHDLLGDPPFSRLDLVTCRNVLIYLDREVQRDVLGLFHYALGAGGFLVLGPSETADATELFRAEDEEHRIYRRRTPSASDARIPVFPLSQTHHPGVTAPDRAGAGIAHGALHYRLVERYAPPSLLVNPDDEVVHLSEHVGRYLIHPGGEPTGNVFKLVRDELRIELRAALHTAREDQRRGVESRPVQIAFEGSDTAAVVLHVRPALEPEQEGFALVIFDERPVPEAAESPDVDAVEPEGDGDGRVAELEAEIEVAERRLQRIIDEYEASQEELRASNEELQSSNEELRSTMEELETSKEELQSMNEELQAVNQENRHKVEELAQLSGDLQNLLIATDIASLFLDRELRIMRFTPKVAELFNVRPADRGRPISDLTNRLGYDDLLADARTVLERLAPVEREVEDDTGRWYMTRVLPYRSPDDRIEGVVITFFDITDRKRMEDELRHAKVFAESIVETLHEPLLVLDPDLRVRSANPAFYETFHVTAAETTGRLIYELGSGHWDIPELRTQLEEVLPTSNVFSDFEVEHTFEGIGQRVMLVNARRLDHAQLILLGIQDITDRKRDERELGAAKRAAERASRVKSQFLSTMSHELRTPLTAVIGIADLMETGALGPTTEKQIDHIARIKRSAWHLVDIIDEILTFSRSESGKEQVQHTQVDFAEVVTDVVGTLQSAPTASAPEIEVAGTETPLPAMADRVKVRQILTNLVGNAIKYSDNGGVTVAVEPNERWVTFHIRDRGPGIPPDQLEEIFEPFVQLDASSTRSKGGTGLGLTISRRLARLLGGDVTVESTVGEGSTFTLRLPRSPAESPDAVGEAPA